MAESPEIQAIKALCGEHPQGHVSDCVWCKIRAEEAAAYLTRKLEAVIKSLSGGDATGENNHESNPATASTTGDVGPEAPDTE